MNLPGKERLVRLLLIVSLPVILLVFFVIAASHFSYTPDDTYIYLQFAKNVIRGDGLAFNAGHPTYGFTGSLWLFIIAAGGFFGADLLMTAKIVDLLFACASVLMFSFLAFEVIRDRVVALAATGAFALNAWFLRWAGSGMETSLAVLLVVAAVWFCLRNEYLPATITAALLALVRPEASLMLALIIADIFLNTDDRKRATRLSLAVVLTYMAVVLPWTVYSALTFGTVLPNTALAKASLHITLEGSASTLVDLGKMIGATDGVAVLVLLVCGGLMMIRRREWVSGLEHAATYRSYLLRQGVLGLGWVAALVLFYGLTGINMISRYVLLVTPFIVLYAFFFLDRVLVHMNALNFRYGAAVICSLAIMTQNHFVFRGAVSPGIDAFSSGMAECFVPIGKWFHNNTPPGTVIFATDVGALGYYSDRVICDGAGLVSPEMLPFVRGGYTFERLVREKVYRTRFHAGYVVYNSFEAGAPAGNPDLVPLFTLVMPRMKLLEARPTYYTVCRVTSTDH